MSRLTKEREAEIRNFGDCDYCDNNVELLAEIDALRLENTLLLQKLELAQKPKPKTCTLCGGSGLITFDLGSGKQSRERCTSCANEEESGETK